MSLLKTVIVYCTFRSIKAHLNTCNPCGVLWVLKHPKCKSLSLKCNIVVTGNMGSEWHSGTTRRVAPPASRMEHYWDTPTRVSHGVTN